MRPRGHRRRHRRPLDRAALSRLFPAFACSSSKRKTTSPAIRADTTAVSSIPESITSRVPQSAFMRGRRRSHGGFCRENMFRWIAEGHRRHPGDEIPRLQLLFERGKTTASPDCGCSTRSVSGSRTTLRRPARHSRPCDRHHRLPAVSEKYAELITSAGGAILNQYEGDRHPARGKKPRSKLRAGLSQARYVINCAGSA